jgi:hypothetical protein
LVSRLDCSRVPTAAAVFYAVTKQVEDFAKDRLHPVLLLDEATASSGHARPSAHPAQLCVGLHGALVAPPRRPVRSRRPIATPLQPLPLLPIEWPSRHRPIPSPKTRPTTSAFASSAPPARASFFASDAVALLDEATAGALRDLDRIAAACLLAAARKKRKAVDRDVVSRVVKRSPRRIGRDAARSSGLDPHPCSRARCCRGARGRDCPRAQRACRRSSHLACERTREPIGRAVRRIAPTRPTRPRSRPVRPGLLNRRIHLALTLVINPEMGSGPKVARTRRPLAAADRCAATHCPTRGAPGRGC